MLAFIKDYSLQKIRIKLVILYALNVSDLLLTLLLISTGCFIEANYLVASLMRNPAICLLAKIALPAVLLLHIFLRIKKATVAQLLSSNKIVLAAAALYVLINLSHLFWLAALIM
ncbi:MAG: DUF5658 family protein [Bacillota bacterium]